MLDGMMENVRGFFGMSRDERRAMIREAVDNRVRIITAGLSMKDIGLMEMHEAFAAQVLSNLQALSSKTFAEEELGRSEAVGHPDLDLINVMGGSLSIGHPFGATGGRLTVTLLNEMARRDVQFGLITVCAAGGMGFAMVVERR